MERAQTLHVTERNRLHEQVGKGRPKLFNGVWLLKECRPANEQFLHAICQRLACRVEHLKLGTPLHRLLGQFETRLWIVPKADVCEQDVNLVDPGRIAGTV